MSLIGCQKKIIVLPLIESKAFDLEEVQQLILNLEEVVFETEEALLQRIEITSGDYQQLLLTFKQVFHDSYQDIVEPYFIYTGEETPRFYRVNHENFFPMTCYQNIEVTEASIEEHIYENERE